MFTCGGVPYAGVPTTTLLRELSSGHRLDKPKNAACTNEMYVCVYKGLEWCSIWLQANEEPNPCILCSSFTIITKDGRAQ